MITENLFLLIKHGFTVELSDDETIITITYTKKTWRVIGLIVSLIGLITCISGILYLLINEESGYQPLLFRMLLSLGIILGILGFSLKNRNKENDIHIDLTNKNLTFGQSKNKNRHVRYTYSFSELSNLRVMKYGSKYVLIVQIGADQSVLFALKTNPENLSLLQGLKDELQTILH